MQPRTSAPALPQPYTQRPPYPTPRWRFVVQVHTAPFRLTPVTAETARLRIVHVPDSVPVAGEGVEVMVQASDASGAVLDMPDLKVSAEMGLKSERSAPPCRCVALPLPTRATHRSAGDPIGCADEADRLHPSYFTPIRAADEIIS